MLALTQERSLDAIQVTVNLSETLYEPITKSFTCQDSGYGESMSVMTPVKATQLYACTDRGDT